MSETVIKVENLSKLYHLGELHKRPDSFREKITNAFTRTFRRIAHSAKRKASNPDTSQSDDHLWALRDVSFEVKRGEVLGIIGRNGAGKSTLLKILSRITKPTEGSAWINGRVGSLLEVGTGFHQELTGRENIFLNGAILGMTKAEIKRKFDEIVEFAEIEKFIDTPVKRYSSGMYVRLAFAVAAHLEPEILLVDEVLAVGDAEFQKKCLGKMGDASKKGKTVLFISHNMAAINALCHSCMKLDRGQIVATGSPDKVISNYMADAHASAHYPPLSNRTERKGNGIVLVNSIHFRDTDTGSTINMAISGSNITVEIQYETTDPSVREIRSFNIGLAFYNNLGQFVMVLNSEMANRAFESLAPAGSVYCQIPRLPLMFGTYYVTSTLQVNGQLADQVETAVSIDVEPGDFFGTGIHNVYGRQGVYVPHFWYQSV